MSKALQTVWDLEPHTAKKHEIFRRYFQAWMPILGRTNPRLLYIDAFAGPGEYSKGEDGSPQIVLKAARDHVLKLSCKLRCVFIEDDKERYDHLLAVLERIKPTLPSNVKFRPPLQGTFNQHLTDIFSEIDEQKRHHAPTLAFVDPFGFSHTPYSAIARMLSYPKTEVLINFMYEEINRFLSNPQFAAHFDSLFGTPDWRSAIGITDPDDRLFAIHDFYLEQIRKAAKYVRAFLMRNKSNSPDYFLFFATNSFEGLEEMKNAMWKVDPTGEFMFSDFTDTDNQLPLFAAEPDYASLRETIASEFRRTEIEIGDLGDWVVEYTPFRRTHIKRHVLAPMENDGDVAVPKPKPGRKPGTYPDGTILKFR